MEKVSLLIYELTITNTRTQTQHGTYMKQRYRYFRTAVRYNTYSIVEMVDWMLDDLVYYSVTVYLMMMAFS